MPGWVSTFKRARNLGRNTGYLGGAFGSAYYRANNAPYGGTPLKRRRVTAVTYIPRGITWNPRSGGFVQKEIKFYDTAATNLFDADKFYASNLISTPAQGTGATNRIGRRFGITSFEVKGEVLATIYNQATADYNLQDFTMFIYVVLDTQVNKSTSLYGAVRNPSSNAFEDLVNMENTDRYTTLARKKIVYKVPNRPYHIGAAQNPIASDEGLGNGVVTFEMFKKFKKPLEVMCEPSNTGAGAAATMNNGIFIIAKVSPLVSGGAASVQIVPTLNWQARVRFCC